MHHNDINECDAHEKVEAQTTTLILLTSLVLNWDSECFALIDTHGHPLSGFSDNVSSTAHQVMTE